MAATKDSAKDRTKDSAEDRAKDSVKVRQQGEDDLNDFIAAQKKKAAKGTVMLAVGIVLLMITGVMLFSIGIVLGIILIGVGCWYRHCAKKEIKEHMTEAALLPALQAVFDKVSYHPEGHISSSVVKNTDMGFDFRIDEVSGSDHIKAEYRGVTIELSDITISTVSTVCDDDGEYETKKVRFRGLWLICDFHKQFSADLLLREREGVLDRKRKKGIHTENEAFNRQFYIESESEHDVFYILTPHMMEYIQNMDAKAGGRTYLRFLKEGKLILALDTGRDAFEVNNVRRADASALREQFISEVRYVTDLIDELHLVKTLYKNFAK